MTLATLAFRKLRHGRKHFPQRTNQAKWKIARQKIGFQDLLTKLPLSLSIRKVIYQVYIYVSNHFYRFPLIFIRNGKWLGINGWQLFISKSLTCRVTSEPKLLEPVSSSSIYNPENWYFALRPQHGKESLWCLHSLKQESRTLHFRNIC